jgi:hypothetical protein
VQLIADYYAFASPAITGQWRVQAKERIWQLGFRGGQLVSLEAPAGEGDLLSFLKEVGSLSGSNLSVLRAFPTHGRERNQVLAELVGGAEKLSSLRRKHALHSIGEMLCSTASRTDFSDLPPQDTGSLGVDALALPYIALRLQPPERLHASLGDAFDQVFRLSRNPKIPVAGLQLDREALNIAKQFTKPKAMAAVVEDNSHGAEALVTYATILTLLGCEMLCAAKPSEISEAPRPVPQPEPQTRVRPPSLSTAPQVDDDGFERVATGVAPPIEDAPPTATVEPVTTEVELTIAAVLKSVDAKLLTDAETILERLDILADKKRILSDYIACNNPLHPDRGNAMIVALSGLQEFTDSHPQDHLGPLLLSRIYDGAENPVMAKIFADQAQRLGGHTDEVNSWTPKQ